MILFRLVLKEYFRFVFGTLLLCLFLFILFDFIHKTSNYFVKYNPSAILITKYYFFQIPFQIMQALPLASLLSSVTTMVLLARSNEVTAMRAAGMGPLAIAAPLAFGGFVLSLTAYALAEFVIPSSSSHMHYVTKVLIEGESAFGLDEQAHWIRSNNKAFNFKEYDHQSQELKGLRFVSLRETFLPEQAIHAESATFMAKEHQWLLKNTSFLKFNELGELSSLEQKANYKASLPIEPSKLITERRLPDEMSIRELNDLIERNSVLGKDVLNLKIAWHVRCAFPLSSLLISLLGLKFAYRSERTTETVRSLLLAFSIGISYWFILSAARAIGGSGDLPPVLAGWLANIVIFVIVCLQFWRIYRVGSSKKLRLGASN